ncbi:aspartyl/asparaginyl beta-hydroxylase domain-containing protein [Streptomyces ehimensis]|uniref:Aspartyl/asparaginyl beta-hydroxylase domain-containing protein n=1 Tax=Streptomyces ehimensis TaxID=68195 RepID=A0ABV9BUY4_9ACTN
MEDEARSPHALVGQVAQLDRLDDSLVERLRHEALTAPAPWKAAYGDYQSGGWWTTSLMNASGDARDVRIGECTARPTDLLADMPVTAGLLADMGLSYMWVRLARLKANAFLWEHRDYDELDQVERHRLHIPLHTNSFAFLVTGGTKIHMTGGRIWRLTPSYAHGVCNLLGPDRIHLIADVYADDAYPHLAKQCELAPSSSETLRRLPRPRWRTSSRAPGAWPISATSTRPSSCCCGCSTPSPCRRAPVTT